MKRKALSVFLTLAFLFALVACIRKPQQVVVQLHWGAYGDAGSSVHYGAQFVGSDGGHHTYGMIPSGQAGGALTGFYPNPGLDAAALGGGGGLNQLTGMVTAGPGTGSQAALIPMPITCVVGETNCGMA